MEKGIRLQMNRCTSEQINSGFYLTQSNFYDLEQALSLKMSSYHSLIMKLQLIGKLFYCFVDS